MNSGRRSLSIRIQGLSTSGQYARDVICMTCGSPYELEHVNVVYQLGVQFYGMFRPANISNLGRLQAFDVVVFSIHSPETPTISALSPIDITRSTFKLQNYSSWDLVACDSPGRALQTPDVFPGQSRPNWHLRRKAAASCRSPRQIHPVP